VIAAPSPRAPSAGLTLETSRAGYAAMSGPGRPRTSPDTLLANPRRRSTDDSAAAAGESPAKQGVAARRASMGGVVDARSARRASAAGVLDPRGRRNSAAAVVGRRRASIGNAAIGGDSDGSDCSFGNDLAEDDAIADLVAKSGADLIRRRSRIEIDKELEDYLQSGQAFSDMAADGFSAKALGEVADTGARASGFQDGARADAGGASPFPEQLRGLDVDLGGSRSVKETAADATLRKLSEWNGGAIVVAEESQKESGAKSGVMQNFGEGISRVQDKLKAVQQQFNRASVNSDGVSPNMIQSF